MKFWLAKNSLVPVREQLRTQVILGILSGDLPAGARLPSTRELARRFKLHPNTVSAAYRELTEQRWIELRQGSGVYVRPLDGDSLSRAALSDHLVLDRLIADFLRTARGRGFSLDRIKRRVADWLELQPPDFFLLIEPDADLRRILEAEIIAGVNFPVRSVGLEEINEKNLIGAASVAMYAQAEAVRAKLPVGATLLLLHTRSVADSLRGEQPPPADALITIASGWSGFLRFARHILLAAGLDHEALNFRNTHDAGWQRALRASHFVITDALTARALPRDTTARVFHLIADSSIAELRSFVADFLTPDGNHKGRALKL